MARARRLVEAALADFGLRRRRAAARNTPPTPSAPPAPEVSEVAITAPPTEVRAVGITAPATELPPGVVWRGAARRRPELQRFCDHLDRLRESVS